MLDPLLLSNGSDETLVNCVLLFWISICNIEHMKLSTCQELQASSDNIDPKYLKIHSDYWFGLILARLAILNQYLKFGMQFEVLKLPVITGVVRQY